MYRKQKVMREINSACLIVLHVNGLNSLKRQSISASIKNNIKLYAVYSESHFRFQGTTGFESKKKEKDMPCKQQA